MKLTDKARLEELRDQLFKYCSAYGDAETCKGCPFVGVNKCPGELVIECDKILTKK